MKHPFDIVRDFEAALCEYTGAPYCVCVNSCTNALFLALKYQYYLEQQKLMLGDFSVQPVEEIEIPKYTYVSVPMQIKHAGFDVSFRDEDWGTSGFYQLKPTCIWDSARWFSKDMWKAINFVSDSMPTDYVCISFHWSKTLGIQQGGAILHNDWEFDKWARKARFDGRDESLLAGLEYQYDMLGYHMYMSPEIAAEGLVRLMHLPKDNKPIPPDNYPDLSQIELFK